MKQQRRMRTGPGRFWYARLTLGISGLVGGVPGGLFGFTIGVLLDQLISRQIFLASVRRIVLGCEVPDEAELYALIALFLREHQVSVIPEQEQSAYVVLRRYLETCLCVVCSGPIDRVGILVHDALSSISTESLWSTLIRVSPPARLRGHRALIRTGVCAVEADSDRVWIPECSPVLGLSGPATEQEVRTAFRSLALRVHPDQADGAQGTAWPYSFEAVRASYETLLTHFGAVPEVPDSAGGRTDPRNHAQSDRRC